METIENFSVVVVYAESTFLRDNISRCSQLDFEIAYLYFETKQKTASDLRIVIVPNKTSDWFFTALH